MYKHVTATALALATLMAPTATVAHAADNTDGIHGRTSLASRRTNDQITTPQSASGRTTLLPWRYVRLSVTPGYINRSVAHVNADASRLRRLVFGYNCGPAGSRTYHPRGNTINIILPRHAACLVSTYAEWNVYGQGGRVLAKPAVARANVFTVTK